MTCVGYEETYKVLHPGPPPLSRFTASLDMNVMRAADSSERYRASN